MVIAHNALKSLDETQLNQLLDTIESSTYSLPPQMLNCVKHLKTELEAHLGSDHVAVLQLKAVLRNRN